MVRVALICLAIAGVGACGHPRSGSSTLSGGLEKGPFVVGSSVSVSALDGNLQPIGQLFETQTIDDAGRFQIDFAEAPIGPLVLEGNGFYYNEILGRLSDAPIALRGLVDTRTDARTRSTT